MGEFFKDFIANYGSTILYAVITAIAGYLGVVIKNIIKRYCDEKTKKDIAKTVVTAVEQLYKDLHGEEKFNKALEAAAEMLTNAGITVTDVELRMLIEGALGEFNDAFKKEEEEKGEDVLPPEDEGEGEDVVPDDGGEDITPDDDGKDVVPDEGEDEEGGEVIEDGDEGAAE